MCVAGNYAMHTKACARIFGRIAELTNKFLFLSVFPLPNFSFDKMCDKEKGNSIPNSNGRGIVKPNRSEKEVGILLHLAKHERFDASVKQRHSDFHVNEIDPSGNIVRLTSYDLPKDTRETVEENNPIFSKWLNEDVRTAIKNLQVAGQEYNLKMKEMEKPVEINVTDASKEERTKIHRWLGMWDKLSSMTIDKDGQKLIVISVASIKNKRYERRPANRGKFTHCVLYKEGIDTTDAIIYLARKLSMRPNHISFAGTKDKKAKTTQRICFSNIEASRLLELNKYSSQSRLGNFSYQAQKLNLGDSSGNHFKIVLKNVRTDSDDVIETAIANLRTQGFINYFGLQRFGSYAAATHLIGKAIIQTKYDLAFDLILGHKPNDPEFMTKAKSIWLETRNAQEAVKLIPRWRRSIESTLLIGLSKHYHLNNFQGALASIPKNTGLLYLHAYQSYIWNRVASFRISEYGLVPVVGDLVYQDGQASVDYHYEVGIEDDSLIGDADGTTSLENTGTELSQTGGIPKVKVLTEEDLPKYTIYDIVIPLQGRDILYPANKVKDYFDQLILDGGIDKECLQKFQSRPDAPKGAYRKLLVIPKNVSFKIIPYADSDNLDNLIPSDLDLLENPGKISADSSRLRENTEGVKDNKCVIFELSLPTSSYATMALREILRGEILDSNAEFQNESKPILQDGVTEPAAKKAKVELE